MRDVSDRFAESVRLARLAGELQLPADVIVVSEAQVEEWGGSIPSPLVSPAAATEDPAASDAAAPAMRYPPVLPDAAKLARSMTPGALCPNTT